MRAAVYARVSTEEQAEKGFSLEDQIERCTQKAKELGASEVVVFADEGYSGADPLRPALQQLLQEVREGKFQLVVCLDVDRWARDLADQLAFASEVEKYARLEFVTHSRGSPDSPEDTLFFQMKGAFAQYERAKIRQRTISGKIKKAKSNKIVVPGGGPGRSGPYGYRYNGDPTNPQFLVNEDEAKVVRQMFEWVALDGLGIGAVTVRLNEMGVPSPRGKKWHPSTVSRILHNEVYAGVFYNFKWRTQSLRPGEKKKIFRKRAREEWIPVTVPAIVSRELWERTQEVIREHGRAVSRKRRYEYLLSGRIRCGICGRKFYAYPQEGKSYYRCAGKRKALTLERCSAPQIPAGPTRTKHGLDEIVWNAVAERLKNPELLRQEFERQISGTELARKAADLAAELEKVQAKITELAKQKDELMDLRMEGLLTPEEVKARLKKLEERRQELANLAQKLRTRLETFRKRMEAPLNVEKFCAQFEKYLEELTPEKKREIIHALDIRVTVYPDGKAVVEWPFDGDAVVPLEVCLEKEPANRYCWQLQLVLTEGYHQAFAKAARQRNIRGSDLIREALGRLLFDAEWVKTLAVPRRACGNITYRSGVLLPEQLYRQLVALSTRTGRSKTEILRRAVEDYLAIT